MQQWKFVIKVQYHDSYTLGKTSPLVGKSFAMSFFSDHPTSNIWLAATLPYHLRVSQAQDLSTESWCNWVTSKRNNQKAKFLQFCLKLLHPIFECTAPPSVKM